MQSIDVELFKDSTAFMLSTRCWGNIKKIKEKKLDTKADPAWYKTSKILLEAPEYVKIRKFLNQVRIWCDARTSPSYFRRGIQIVRRDMADTFETQLNKFKATLRETLVKDLVNIWDDAIKVAETKLADLYNPADYPNKADLPFRFDIQWNFVGFTVPDNLPKELFEAEKKRVEQQWKEAEEMILFGLRESFSKLVDHAIERLKVAPGEKPKIFKKGTIENIQEFIALFSAKNIMNDVELAKLVEKAKAVMVDADAESLRGDVDMRAKLVQKFEPVKTEIDKLIVERPSRTFDFSEESEGDNA